VFYTDDNCYGICKEITEMMREEYLRAQNNTYEYQQSLTHSKVMQWHVQRGNPYPNVPRLYTDAIRVKAVPKLQIRACENRGWCAKKKKKVMFNNGDITEESISLKFF